MTAKERYEIARVNHLAWFRRLQIAQRNGTSEGLKALIRFELEQAQTERARAFEAFMDSEE